MGEPSKRNPEWFWKGHPKHTHPIGSVNSANANPGQNIPCASVLPTRGGALTLHFATYYLSTLTTFYPSLPCTLSFPCGHIQPCCHFSTILLITQAGSRVSFSQRAKRR